METESCRDVSSVKVIARFSDLQLAETRFRQACYQIHLLNIKLNEIKERYSKAKNDNFRGLRYNLRLKLAVIEGARNMYYEFAYMKAEKVAELRHELFGETIDIVASDSETDDDWE